MRVRIAMAACMGLSLIAMCASCSNDAEDGPVPASEVSPTHLPTEDLVTGPSGRSGMGPGEARDGINMYDDVRSSKQLFARYTREEERLLRGFYDKFGSEVMQFDNPEQFSWLVDQGFPLPDDVLVAMNSSQEQLLERFEAGDTTAGFLYLTRETEQVHRGDARAPDFQHLDKLQAQLLGSGSPFAGYAYFDYQLRGRRDAGAAYAGLGWAFDAGDQRAGLVMAKMLASHNRQAQAPIDPAALLFAYMNLQDKIRAVRPELLNKRWEPYPL